MAISGVGTYQDFSFTGAVQAFTVPQSGLYKLETWGAQGGASYSKDDDDFKQYGTGGKGGYSVGYIKLTKGEVIYVVVGGKGEEVSTDANNPITGGGYNGGGDTCRYYNDNDARYLGAGGGATHIAKRTGVLSELENYKSTILIVAGGGGSARPYGSIEYSYGGDGGGLTGEDGIGYNNTYGKGGTQTAGGYGDTSGSFGQGASAISTGAGGGGYYGGGANGAGGGGGGSAYIGGVPTLLISGVTYSASTLSGQNEGDGKARITLVTVALSNIKADVEGVTGTAETVIFKDLTAGITATPSKVVFKDLTAGIEVTVFGG